jgi:hypothetical protein
VHPEIIKAATMMPTLQNRFIAPPAPLLIQIDLSNIVTDKQKNPPLSRNGVHLVNPSRALAQGLG